MAFDQFGNFIPDEWGAKLPQAQFPGGFGGAPQGQNFTQGPPGSSGGLTGGMQPPTQWAPNQAQMQYGYGTAPGSSGRGYYEQQTPMGSFAASDWTGSQGVNLPQQQFGQAYGAINPFIGQTSQGIGQQQSVLPYAQQVASQALKDNPFLGLTSTPAAQAGSNQYMGRNPYLEASIGDALGQSSKSFMSSVMPSFDRASMASGSFGNTGIQAAKDRAIENFGRGQSAAATNAYMQDYGNTQQLAENALNRQQQVNLTNAGLSAGDLSRNLGGFYTGQGLGLQGLGQVLGAAQFDANLGQQGSMFNSTLGQADLGRNAGLAQGQGQFNAGQLTGMSQFNAGQGNQLGLSLANLLQNNNQFNASQRNNMNQFNAGSANSMLSQQRNLNQQQGQFDASLDRQIWNDNMGWMRQGQQDQLGLLGQLLGWNQQGIGNATTVQNTPLSYLQQLAQIGQGLGGMGNQSSTPLNGNPLMGGIGGALTAAQLYQAIFGQPPKP